MRIFSQSTSNNVFAIINLNDCQGIHTVGFTSAFAINHPEKDLVPAIADVLEIRLSTCENVVAMIKANPSLDGYEWVSPSDFRALKELALHILVYDQYLENVYGVAPVKSTFIVNLNTGRSMTFSTLL